MLKKSLHPFLLAALCLAHPLQAAEYPEDGWWWNPDESGRGYLIERQGEVMFIASFHYAANGTPEWLTIQGQYVPTEDSTSAIGTFDGDVYLSSNGQCLGCAYVAPTTVPSIQTPAQIQFTDNQHGTLSWRGEVVPIQRIFWGWNDGVGQLQGDWALSRTENGATSTQLVHIQRDNSVSISTANISGIADGSSLGTISLADGSLTLNLASGNLALPVRMPETSRFYAGTGSASGAQIVATRLDDTPFDLISSSGPISTAAVLCPYSQNTLNTTLNLTSSSSWTCSGSTRALTANGIPDHPIGIFPNAGNPNTVRAQSISFSTTTAPVLAATINTDPRTLAYALNGVKFDPGTAGTCPSNAASTTQCDLAMGMGQFRIEALGQSSFNFGVDDNNAHVQPNGEYHYHGMPEGSLSNAEATAAAPKMVLVAWAPDGYPVYARYGHSDAANASSPLRAMTGSYALKSTPDSGRPAVALIPMGAFLQDWEYVAGSGDLDECNGRSGSTPEFPGGIYHYYATDSYPYLPRCWKGAVN